MRQLVFSCFLPVLIATLFLSIAASYLCAAEPYTLPNGIVVTDDIPIGKLPANVATMTQNEFIVWAKQHNQRQVAEADKRQQKYLMTRPPLRTARITEGSSSFLTKFGDSPYIESGGFYANPLNAISTQARHSRRSYSLMLPDLNDHGGGPIDIINPFCWEFWRTHTEAE